jgi:hypothetical protein
MNYLMLSGLGSCGRQSHFIPRLRDLRAPQKFNRSELAKDYNLVLRKSGRSISLWEWEIIRISRPLGVKLNGTGFNAEHKARLAGEKALHKLLDNIALERG